MHRGQIPFARQKSPYARGSNPVCTGVRCRLHGKNLRMQGGQTPYAQGSDTVCMAKISVCKGVKPRMHGKKQAVLAMQAHIVHHAYGNFLCEYANFLHACNAGPLCKAIFPGLHTAKYPMQTTIGQYANGLCMPCKQVFITGHTTYFHEHTMQALMQTA